MMTGEMIAGRYRLDRRLGIGGMSTVQLAVDERLEREVAVKLLAEHLAEDPTFVSRFQREALAAARLVHPNIVQVFDYGLDEISDRHYIVMEFVDGRSCSALLRERGHLDIDEALDIVMQSCRGLEYAHRHGVVHRDVKPGNLLVANDANVKLADFGIAKATEQASITQVGSVLGTAAYLAPEQARGQEAGPASDLYSLGVVTYQLLSGRLPYEASSLSELALMQQRELPTPLEAFNPSVPITLARAVARALSINPEDRYETALEMGDALTAGARGIDPDEYDDLSEPKTDETRIVSGAVLAGAGAASAAASLTVDPDDSEFGDEYAPRRPRTRGATPAASNYGAGGPGGRASTTASQGQQPSPNRALRIFILLLVLVGIGAAGGVLISSQFDNSPQLQRVIYNDVNQSVEGLKGLVDSNTR